MVPRTTHKTTFSQSRRFDRAKPDVFPAVLSWGVGRPERCMRLHNTEPCPRCLLWSSWRAEAWRLCSVCLSRRLRRRHVPRWRRSCRPTACQRPTHKSCIRARAGALPRAAARPPRHVPPTSKRQRDHRLPRSRCPLSPLPPSPVMAPHQIKAQRRPMVPDRVPAASERAAEGEG